MYPRDNSYKKSHQQWTESVDKIAKEIGVDQKKVSAILQMTISDNLADQVYYDYQHNPKKLLNSLVDDTRKFLTSYDCEFLREQGDLVRLYMRQVTLLLDEIDREISNDNESLRAHYDKLCKKLSKYATQLQEEKEFYSKLSEIYDRYGIHIQKPTKVPTPENVEWLREVEIREYQEALQILNKTISRVSNSVVKQDCIDLVKKIESNRELSEKKSLLFPNKPFDYKRQTINLKKTNDFIHNPYDISSQNEYAANINSNRHDKEILEALAMIGASIVMAIIYSIFVVCVPPAIGCLAIPAATLSYGTANLIKETQGTTASRMLTLFNHIKPKSTEPELKISSPALVL